MPSIRTFVSRLWSTLFKSGSERELSEEVEFHLEMQTEANVRRGMSPGAARRQAIREFGGVEQVKERYRDRRGLPFLETLAQDLRYGTRMLRKHRGFAIVAVLSIALCIGANTAIFSVLDAVLLRPLPYPDSDRLVTLFNVYPAIAPATSGQNSVPDYLDRKAETDIFESLATFHFRSYNVELDGSPQRVLAIRTTPSLLEVLGVQPALGRPFTAAEGEVGNDHAVILSHSLWIEMFGGLPEAVGRSIRLDGTDYDIVGVMPPGFDIGNRGVQMMVAWAFTESERGDEARHGNFAEMLGRLRPGVTVEQAQARIDAVNARNLERFPEFRPLVERLDFATTVIGLQDQLVRFVRPTLLILQGCVVIVLLIGCVNIANLQLMRSITRGRELAVRAAIGASRWRVVRQLMTESVLLALIGGLVGLLLGRWGTGVLVHFAHDQLPFAGEVAPNATVILFTTALALLTGLASGVIPALHVAHGDLEHRLRQGGREDSAGRSTSTIRNVLVITQVALAFVVLMAAGLLVRSFERVLEVDPGFRPERVLTARLSLPESRYGQEERIQTFITRAQETLSAQPGVLDVGFTTLLPFGAGGNKSVVTVEGYELGDGESLPLPHNSWVGGTYFEAMGVPLIAGRLFDARDDLDAPPVALVDQEFAERYWPDGQALGKRIHRGAGSGSWMTVVGIVGVAEFDDLADSDRRGTVYFPYSQPTPERLRALRRDVALVIRAEMPETRLTNVVRATILRLDPQLPVFDVEPMSARLDASLLPRRAPMMLVLAFGGLAFLLSLVGLYGVIAQSVAQRTREIGIRMAIGAQRGRILAQVLWQAARLAVIGLAVGLAGALWLGRLLETLLFGVSPSDPTVFAAVALLLVVASLVAGWIPSRRASRVDVVGALRSE